MVRRRLFLVLLLGVVGMGAELLLLEHWEDPLQWTPIAMLGVALPLTAVAYLGRSAAMLVVHKVLMSGFVLAGLIGVGLHFKGNVEFELEMYPTRGGFELIREALMGATPALAPGAMLLLGLLGLVAVSGERADQSKADSIEGGEDE